MCIRDRPRHCWARIAYKELSGLGMASVYVRDITRMRVEYDILNVNKSFALKRIDSVSSDKLREKCRKNKKSMILMFPNEIVHCKKSWINDSFLSGLLCKFWACDLGLGNRAPLQNNVQYKLCKPCKERIGVNVPNNEIHLLISCPFLGKTRAECGISDFISMHRGRGVWKSETTLARLYLGSDGSNKDTLLGRAKSLEKMLQSWEKAWKMQSNASLRKS